MLPADRRLRIVAATSPPQDEGPNDDGRPPPVVVLPDRRGRKEFADHGAFALYVVHRAITGGIVLAATYLMREPLLRVVEMLATRL